MKCPSCEVSLLRCSASNIKLILILIMEAQTALA